MHLLVCYLNKSLGCYAVSLGVQFPVYSSQCTVPGVQFPVYSSLCTVPCIQFPVYSSLCTVRSVPKDHTDFLLDCFTDK